MVRYYTFNISVMSLISYVKEDERVVLGYFRVFEHKKLKKNKRIASQKYF